MNKGEGLSSDPLSFRSRSGDAKPEVVAPRRDERGLLDPRTFPVERIADLVHALPPPGVAVDVADVGLGTQAVEWLSAHGRPARLVFAPADAVETRLWQPSPGLSAVKLERVGRALDLGCGTGRDAVFLAMRGWQVTAVDHLPDALERAQSLAELHGVALDLRRIDVEREPLPEGAFDLVTAFRYLPDLQRMARALAPGGTMIVETFTDRERARTGKPKDARLVLPAEALPTLPEDLTLVDYRVAEHGGRELAMLCATAPFL